MIPLLIELTSEKHYVLAVRILANLVVNSLQTVEVMIDNGILEALKSFVEDEESIVDQHVDLHYARWLVLFILSNVVTADEHVIERVIASGVCQRLIAVMKDDQKNKGLFKEFVFFLSNLICSASPQQVRV